MSLQHHVLLMLVLLVQASGFKPSNEETEPETRVDGPVFAAGFPGNQTTVVGADVTFECKVQSGKSSGTHMQWMKFITARNGPDGLPYVKVLESSSLNTEVEVLTLKNVTLQDAGEYTCLAGNSVGFTVRKAWLTVVTPEPPQFAPRWLRPERMAKDLVSVPEGGTVKFQCAAAANPAPTLNWFKNGRSIETEQRPGGFKVRNKTWTLAMTSVSPPDGGNYTCVVQNKHGLLEHTFQLQVTDERSDEPVLEAGFPGNQTAVVGADVTFECRVQSGKFSPRMQWLKSIKVNGSRFGPDGHPYVKVLESSGLSSEVEVLTLRNVTLQDAGEYTCLAGNAVGFNFRTVWLTVVTPEPPREEPGLS